MANYDAIFSVRLGRAKREHQRLGELLAFFTEEADNNDFANVDAIDLEGLEVSSKALAEECERAKTALKWHVEKQNGE